MRNIYVLRNSSFKSNIHYERPCISHRRAPTEFVTDNSADNSELCVDIQPISRRWNGKSAAALSAPLLLVFYQSTSGLSSQHHATGASRAAAEPCSLGERWHGSAPAPGRGGRRVQQRGGHWLRVVSRSCGPALPELLSYSHALHGHIICTSEQRIISARSRLRDG